MVRRMEERYRERLPLIPGAPEAVEQLATRWPLGLASSSNRPLIDLALELSGLARCFTAMLSSEEVSRGKPAPDVYLEAVRRVGGEPARAACARRRHCLVTGRAVARRDRPPLLGVAGEQHARVVAAEAHRVRECDVDLRLA